MIVQHAAVIGSFFFEAAVHKIGAVVQDEQHVAGAICFPGDPVALAVQQAQILAVQAHWLAAREGPPWGRHFFNIF